MRFPRFGKYCVFLGPHSKICVGFGFGGGYHCPLLGGSLKGPFGSFITNFESGIPRIQQEATEYLQTHVGRISCALPVVVNPVPKAIAYLTNIHLLGKSRSKDLFETLESFLGSLCLPAWGRSTKDIETFSQRFRISSLQELLQHELPENLTDTSAWSEFFHPIANEIVAWCTQMSGRVQGGSAR